MAFNMASNGNIGFNRKRRDQDYIFNDDFTQNSFDNTHKKVKMSQDANPSCVVHIRNVPHEMDDVSISNLAVPFGYIDNIVLVRKNNQALIQMQDKNDALSMVDYYATNVPLLHGKHLFVQFSKHQQLDLRTNNANVDKLVQQANEKREIYVSNWMNDSSNGAAEILRILIDNAPNLIINHLVFYKIFNRFGHIVRIVSFTKNNTQHHGLVEFANPLPAHVAQLQLNGLNLLGENGTMRVDFSKNPGPLQVQRPSDKVRDYSITPINAVEMNELDTPQYNFPLFSSRNPPMMRDAYMNNPKMAPQQYSNMNNNMDLTPAAAMAAASLMAACNQMNHRQADQTNSWGFGTSQNQNSMYQQQPQMLDSGNSVVLVTNLNAEKSNPDALFTLFGVYGDVLRVKVMFNKKNTALVQFMNHQQAMTAINHLDGIFLWGKQMHLHVSKTNVIQMPMEDANHGMTKDYANSNLHRFKKPNSKNFQNIYSPGSVLHLSNIPPLTTDDDLIVLVESKGYNVKKFKFLPNDKKMALMELGSVEDAIHVLIDFHNYKLSEKNHLRISFSKAGAF